MAFKLRDNTSVCLVYLGWKTLNIHSNPTPFGSSCWNFGSGSSSAGLVSPWRSGPCHVCFVATTVLFPQLTTYSRGTVEGKHHLPQRVRYFLSSSDSSIFKPCPSNSHTLLSLSALSGSVPHSAIFGTDLDVLFYPLDLLAQPVQRIGSSISTASHFLLWVAHAQMGIYNTNLKSGHIHTALVPLQSLLAPACRIFVAKSALIWHPVCTLLEHGKITILRLRSCEAWPLWRWFPTPPGVGPLPSGYERSFLRRAMKCWLLKHCLWQCPGGKPFQWYSLGHKQLVQLNID